MFGPQPRSYEYQLPKKVEKGALRAALSAKLQEGAVVLVDELTASEIKTKAAASLLKSAGRSPARRCWSTPRSTRSSRCRCGICPDVTLRLSNRVTARDVAVTRKVVVTKAAMERLEAALGARS